MNVLLSILLSIGTKFLTEKFVTRVSVLLLDKLAKSTENDLDDKLVQEVKRAVGME